MKTLKQKLSTTDAPHELIHSAVSCLCGLRLKGYVTINMNEWAKIRPSTKGEGHVLTTKGGLHIELGLGGCFAANWSYCLADMCDLYEHKIDYGYPGDGLKIYHDHSVGAWHDCELASLQLRPLFFPHVREKIMALDYFAAGMVNQGLRMLGICWKPSAHQHKWWGRLHVPLEQRHVENPAIWCSYMDNLSNCLLYLEDEFVLV